MDSALWPSTIPELFRQAARGLVAVDADAVVVADRLRSGLGIDQHVRLDAEDVVCARDAARSDDGELDRLALVAASAVGRQLLHQYPSSSILWDAVAEELADVFGAFRFARSAGGVWNREAGGGRTIVVERREAVGDHADERRFTLHWGVVLPTVPFCRHGGPHRMHCCAISGGMGSVRTPHAEHTFIVSVGMVVELLAGSRARLVGREGFRARLHRLASFCDRVVERERLVEIVRDQPWRNGIGIAERLRNADLDELGELLP